MYNLILFIFVATLSGCAGFDMSKVDLSPAQGLSNQWQGQRRQVSESNESTGVDRQCWADCRALNYGQGYCSKQCAN
jgi:hypothetical protein